MPVLRQITTCTEPSTVVIERRVRARDRSLDYRLEVCRRHRWLASNWTGRRSAEGAGGRCGTVTDYRPYTQIVQSHAALWLVPLTTNGPQDHDGDLAAALRAGHELLTAHREPTGVAIALEHAARIAEAVTAGSLPLADGQAQVLAALSAAETLDAGARGA
ncbi:hypothetical protein RI578_41100 (plasmid) [Streptomyces sp. BB1-1-1]|uniref:hypothetical protein n=1 Tax=Streptomyces TaxID=1883 RepID=UPI0005E98181|nr:MULTISPECIES: hypothetical protein [unclassified Streptomyces]OLO25977.1 hypothetical protein PZ61_0236955 [Streptomyces sp. MNU77]WND40692.1 hypothetical protein RI578_41100 [Streptomyces sp. BB1-1-1]